jgi:hypothetical protein
LPSSSPVRLASLFMDRPVNWGNCTKLHWFDIMKMFLFSLKLCNYHQICCQGSGLAQQHIKCRERETKNSKPIIIN